MPPEAAVAEDRNLGEIFAFLKGGQFESTRAIGLAS